MKQVFYISLLVIAFVCFNLSGWTSPHASHCLHPRSLQVILPDGSDSVMENIKSLLISRITERCRMNTNNTGNADLKIKLKVSPELGKDGFRIATMSSGVICIAGNNYRGIIYGVGKYLRTSNYNDECFSPSKWRGQSIPEKSIRGVYFATHFGNFYQNAPVKEIERYVEDLALWGFNSLIVWYDMHHFNGFDDPEAISFRKRLESILKKAHSLDLEVGFTVIANEGYANSPVELRAVPGGSRGGNYPQVICPGKPGGMEYILKNMGDLFEWSRDLGLDYVCIWPYDQGGCGSADCQPWGTNGFLKCAEGISDLAKKKIPDIKIILSTWMFDRQEWQGLVDIMAKKNNWVDVVMAENILGATPGNLPMIGFPEISMYETFPWGGFGATPLPDHYFKQWNNVKDQLAGGFLYSEGIYEDINKVCYSGFYWNQDAEPDSSLREYIAYEYSPLEISNISRVIATLEKNHHFRWWPGELDGIKLQMDWFPSKNIAPQKDIGAEDAYRLMTEINGELPERVRQSWRWRILYIRTMLDAELKMNGGTPNKKCIDGFRELMKIYHTSAQTDPALKPPVPFSKNE